MYQPLLKSFWSAVQSTVSALTHWGRDKMDAIFKCILLNENVWIMIKNSLKFVPKGQISNIPALVQVMTWRRQVSSHYLNQYWLVYRRIYTSFGLNELSHVREYNRLHTHGSHTILHYHTVIWCFANALICHTPNYDFCHILYSSTDQSRQEIWCTRTHTNRRSFWGHYFSRP